MKNISFQTICLIIQTLVLGGTILWGVVNMKTTTATLAISVDSLTTAVKEIGTQVNRHDIELAVLRAVREERARTAGSK